MSYLFPDLPELRRFNGAELIIDSFAGGGGASTGIELALGRSPDVAINHDDIALAMHAANHPKTRHLNSNIWRVDPAEVEPGRPIGLFWASPDCTHHSKAKGGVPIRHESRNSRDLGWIVVLWAKKRRPRVIILENVEEWLGWGPLVLDGNGELRPDPDRKGETFRQWVGELKRLGYKLEWRELRACDYGAPTIRKRLFLIARCDGQPIVWPAPTHGPGRTPYRTAAEIIDWSLPCPSIFDRKRPLAEATLRRIAAGLRRFVFESASPFIVNTANSKTTGRGPNAWAATASPGFALVTPFVSTYYGPKREGEVRGCPADGMLGTQTTENRHALVCAFLAKHYGGVVGHGVDQPIGTVTTVDHHSLVTSHLVKMRGTADYQIACSGASVEAPINTISAGGIHVGEVRAFLIKYFSSAQHGQPVDEPLHTVTTKPRFGLVTIHGEQYEIADIGLRMLTPRELFRAQGFPSDYVIDLEVNGRPLSKAAQVRCCGNSVSPPIAAALVKANYVPALEMEAA